MNPAFAIAILLLIGILGLASWGRRRLPQPAALKLAAVLGAGALMVALTLVAPRLVWLAIGGLAVYTTLSRLARMRSAGFPGGSGPSQPASSVETPFLRAHLDHETGEMDAEVIDGPWRGRRLSQLPLEELQSLYTFLLDADEQSARILETYLDREHTGWGGAGHGAAGKDGGADEARNRSQPAMDERRALEILGLEPGADRDAIVAAHRRLINKLHPDRGGSSYLAAEINGAKDWLLKQR